MKNHAPHIPHSGARRSAITEARPRIPIAATAGHASVSVSGPGAPQSNTRPRGHAARERYRRMIGPWCKRYVHREIGCSKPSGTKNGSSRTYRATISQLDAMSMYKRRRSSQAALSEG